MKSFKGYGFFVAMLLVILVVYVSSDFLMNATQKSYTITQFKEDLSAGMIKSVDVIQNPEIPTGEIRAKYSQETKSLYVSDVNTILAYMEEKNFSQVKVSDVARTPWYLELLPYAIGFVLIFVLFNMMSSNANGGGGGGKMMNFGKSRAKLTMPDDKIKTFADVAGLVEEKEQLESLALRALMIMPLKQSQEQELWVCFGVAEGERIWELEEIRFLGETVRILQSILAELGMKEPPKRRNPSGANKRKKK